ncbi:MAG: electron transport complex subunit RsxC [Chromatiales bacterium]|nr:MAG: electron transport complex subunit RsxC [Chromatiales bacterium]
MNQPLLYNRQPPRPAWGVRVDPRKTLSTSEPIVAAPLPTQVQLPLELGPERRAQAVVAPGDYVYTGQPVARLETGARNVVCASISGRVAAIRPGPIPGPGPRVAECIVIDSDGQDRRHADCVPAGDPARLAAARLRELIAQAGIVGLGGAVFPTADKLGGSQPVDLLIVNGAECEPYISCDEMLMRERAAQVLDGARIMLRALGCDRAVVAVESDMPAARLALRAALDADRDPRLDIAEVTAKYPAGGERQLVELLTGREVPAGGLPRDVGIVCQNVATAAAVSELFRTGCPLISRIVTVTGGGILNPVNVEARLGAPLADLVAAAGGYTTTNCDLVMGGPMMGMALAGDRLPVTEATNCLLVAAPGELSDAQPGYPCIRCAECSRVCPARLLPQELLVACDTQDPDRLEQLHLDACIECGCCDYVCPSRLTLTPVFAQAKIRQRAHREQQRQARLAQQRSEARNARLAAAEKRYADGPAPDAGEAALTDLLARVEQRDERGDGG